VNFDTTSNFVNICLCNGVWEPRLMRLPTDSAPQCGRCLRLARGTRCVLPFSCVVPTIGVCVGITTEIGALAVFPAPPITNSLPLKSAFHPYLAKSWYVVGSLTKLTSLLKTRLLGIQLVWISFKLSSIQGILGRSATQG